MSTMTGSVRAQNVGYCIVGEQIGTVTINMNNRDGRRVTMEVGSGLALTHWAAATQGTRCW